MTPIPQGSEPWMPNGFPPPSFVVETERITTFAGARGRWLAAAAILGALLLIAGVVLIANQKDDKTALKSGSSTSAPGSTTATLPGSTLLDPTAGGADATLPPGGAGGGGGALDPSLTVPGGGGGGGGTGTTVGGGGGGGGGGVVTPPPGATPAALATSAGAISIPKVDSTAGPQFGKITLRNSGGSPVNYTSQSQFPNSLTIDKPSGTLAPGASIELTITLDGTKLGEGAFSGQVGFDGAGSPRVTVTSTIGRPPVILDTAGEPCAAETTTCSKQIKLEPNNTPNATPCNTSWSYRVAVSDESQLKAVRADTTTDVELKINNAPNGPSGIWQSGVQNPVAAGTTLKFTIEAVDVLDYTRRSTERTITC